MKEQWKTIPGFSGIYQISNYGKVKSLNHKVYHSDGKNRIQKGRVLKQFQRGKGYKKDNGYLSVSLTFNGKKNTFSVHRLVALAFVENPKGKPQVNHKDGNKQNNLYTNLEWVTNRENLIHAYNNNLISINYGEKHHMSKLSKKDVLQIRSLSNNGVSGSDLSKKYKISQTSISNIINFKTYKHE